MNNDTSFAELLQKYIDGSLTPDEKERLILLLASSENDGELEQDVELEQLLKESYRNSGEISAWNDDYRKAFVGTLLQRIEGDSALSSTERPLVSLRRNFLPYAAALALILGAAIYTYYTKQRTASAITHIKPVPVQNDLGPGGNKAILTLADGSSIILDSVNNGKLASQGNVEVTKLANGQLSYTIKRDSLRSNNLPIAYNTLTTPMGGQYQIVLEDGTKVWLNAASSITYATPFVAKERNVKITGEAYFEVKKDRNRPFHVDANNTLIEVLGTHFNVNAYTDESSVKTTLLEGSVRVNKGPSFQFLAPGQQADVDEKIWLRNNVDLEQIMAWKNGLFIFSGADIEAIMRQLCRWYNLDVVYKDKITEKFYGKIPRSTNVSDVFKVLAMTGKIQFKIEGRRIAISK